MVYALSLVAGAMVVQIHGCPHCNLIHKFPKTLRIFDSS